MALPPWTVELLRRGIADVAKKATEPETIQKLKSQASELLQELPETAARGLDRVMRTAESGKESVRRWSRKHTALAIPVLNATGVLTHPEGTGVPAADDAISAAVDVLRGDAVGGDVLGERLARRYARLVDGEHAIAVASSFPAALSWLTMLLEQYTLVVHRHSCVRLPTGVSLADAIPLITEVGAVDAVHPEDFAGLDSFGIVQADVGESPIAKFEVGDVQIAVLPIATFSPQQVAGISSPIPSALGMLQSGFDLVVMPGDVLAGGPNCGIIVGKRELVDAITRSESWETLSASDAAEAMMLVSLELAATNTDSLPIVALLSTSEDNLKGRAERQALRLSSSDSIASCHVTAESAKLTITGRWQLPSRQLRVRHQSMAAEAWAAKLRDDAPSLWVRIDGEEIIIDLKWIAPADDSKIADALLG